jgi:exopolysaccharide production protein ExoQ
MSFTTARYTANDTWDNAALWNPAQATDDLDRGPVYNYVSIWLLLLPILFLAAAGMPSILNAGSNNGTMTQNSALLGTAQAIRPQVVWYFLTMGYYILLGHKAIWRVALKNKVLLLAPAFGALTALWSASPKMTFRVTIELLITTAFAFYLSEKFSTERLMRILVFAGTVGAFLSVVLVVLLPAVGIYHRDDSGAWQGITSHKNALGIAMAYLLTPIFFIRASLLKKLIYVGTLLFLVYKCQSRGAWFITAGVLLLVAWIGLFRRLKRNEKLLITLISVSMVVVVVGLGVTYFDPIMRGIGKDPTMTGRSDIYIAVLRSIMKHPIFGYGMGAFWFGVNPESNAIALEVHWPSIGYAENGLLEAWLQIGAIGLVLAMYPVIRALQLCVRLLRPPFYNARVGWFLSIIFLELITNIEGGVVLAATSLNWTLTLIAVVGVMKEYRQYTRGTEIVPVNALPPADYSPVSSL